MVESETLVKVEHLGKKFCRRLKRSLWYGLQDIGAELTGSARERVKLRKEEFWALDDISFEIKRGELVGLIGGNGAGKTTLLKVLSGLIKPDVGQITVRGKIQALIALGAGFNPVLTARENIYINGAVLGFSKKKMDQLLDEIMDFSEIGEFIDMPVQSFSSGMQVRLGFAVAVNLKPDILIVDEVLAVGDAGFRRKARNKMMELLHSGISVLFVSHNMALISSITSRCLYLNQGKLLATGPSDEVTSLYLRDSIKRSKKFINHAENPYMASAYLCLPEVMVLKQVTLTNPKGTPTEEFFTHDTITVRFEMELSGEISKLSFALGVRSEIDDVVIGFSKITPAKDSYQGINTLECKIENNRLREGIYNIGFYVSDYNSGAIFKSNNVQSFTILAEMSTIEHAGASQGFVVMDTQWNVL